MQAIGLFTDGLPGSEKYHIEKEIGHGTFSEVHQATCKSTGELVALKNVHFSDEGVIPIHVSREIDVLQRLQGHPHIIALKDICQQAYSISLVLQHCITDLYSILHNNTSPLPGPLIKTIMHQLLQALDALHSASYIHRDVSPSNILFDHDGNLRLSDFGQARHYVGSKSEKQEEASPHVRHPIHMPEHTASGNTTTAAAVNTHRASDQLLSPSVGTRWYKAPELLFGSRTYTSSIDMWSTGCIFAELLMGTAIFPGRSDIDQICKIRNLLGSLNEEIWPGVCELPDWGKLVFPPLERKEWRDILVSTHSHGNEGIEKRLLGVDSAAIELLEGLLQYDPEKRLSAHDALHAAFFDSVGHQEKSSLLEYIERTPA